MHRSLSCAAHKDQETVCIGKDMWSDHPPGTFVYGTKDFCVCQHCYNMNWGSILGCTDKLYVQPGVDVCCDAAKVRFEFDGYCFFVRERTYGSSGFTSQHRKPAYFEMTESFGSSATFEVPEGTEYEIFIIKTKSKLDEESPWFLTKRLQLGKVEGNLPLVHAWTQSIRTLTNDGLQGFKFVSTNGHGQQVPGSNVFNLTLHEYTKGHQSPMGLCPVRQIHPVFEGDVYRSLGSCPSIDVGETVLEGNYVPPVTGTKFTGQDAQKATEVSLTLELPSASKVALRQYARDKAALEEHAVQAKRIQAQIAHLQTECKYHESEVKRFKRKLGFHGH